MRRGVIVMAMAAGLMVGCGDEPTRLVAPVLDVVDEGPAVVATTTEIGWVAELASDPFLEELFSALPRGESALVLNAANDLQSGLYAAPGASYREFERSLVVLGQSSSAADADAELAQGALDLYRDWSQMTLFGKEQPQPGRSADRAGH